MQTHDTKAYGPTVLRIALGSVFLVHGLVKVFVFTLPGTAAFFESVGFPGWTAWPVTAAEIGGGTLLLVGWGTRWAALGLVPVMLGATSVHWSNGFMFTNPNGGWEFTAFLALTSFALFLQAEDGRLSLGEWLRQRRRAATLERPAVASRRSAA